MVEISVTPRDIDQVHRRPALRDGESDNRVGYTDLLVLGGAAYHAQIGFYLRLRTGRRRAAHQCRAAS
jgi:hypothetical protein